MTFRRLHINAINISIKLYHVKIKYSVILKVFSAKVELICYKTKRRAVSTLQGMCKQNCLHLDMCFIGCICRIQKLFDVSVALMEKMFIAILRSTSYIA